MCCKKWRLFLIPYLNFSTILVNSEPVVAQASWNAPQIEVFSRYWRTSLVALKNLPCFVFSEEKVSTWVFKDSIASSFSFTFLEKQTFATIGSEKTAMALRRLFSSFCGTLNPLGLTSLGLWGGVISFWTGAGLWTGLVEGGGDSSTSSSCSSSSSSPESGSSFYKVGRSS